MGQYTMDRKKKNSYNSFIIYSLSVLCFFLLLVIIFLTSYISYDNSININQNVSIGNQTSIDYPKISAYNKFIYDEININDELIDYKKNVYDSLTVTITMWVGFFSLLVTIILFFIAYFSYSNINEMKNKNSKFLDEQEKKIQQKIDLFKKENEINLNKEIDLLAKENKSLMKTLRDDLDYRLNFIHEKLDFYSTINNEKQDKEYIKNQETDEIFED